MANMTRRSPLSVIGAAVLAITAAVNQPVSAQTSLKVIVFPVMSNLPLLAAQSQGFFTKRGLSIEIVNTPNSTELRDGLAQGRYQIAHGGVDNAVAMVETAKVDAVILLGGDNGFNHLLVQPEIKSYEDLRGKTVIVDAPNTAFALLLYKMLDVKGLKKGDYAVKQVGASFARIEAMLKDKSNAASMLNLPWMVQGTKAGLRDMGAATDVVGAYQSTAGWVMRAWAQGNSDTLVSYIQAYVEGVRWALNPANKDQAIAMAAERFKIPQDIAAESYTIATDPVKGFAKDAKFDLEGFRNLLKLRAEILGQWGGTPLAPDKYLDFSHYQRALTGL
jgi:ABC-type nitrate/sulfonate/bicarbonate transport system substrate-binding protein